MQTMELWGRTARPREREGGGLLRPAARRAGLSLVEILLATFVLAVVMIPILQLIFGGIKETARGRDRATAVSLATNIMTQLLDKVPFSQIAPEGGPKAQDPAEFFQAPDETAGGVSDRDQALLGGDLGSEFEKILDQDDSPGDGVRSIFKEGTRFEVILYAGVYQDDGDDGGGTFNAPHMTDELTFSYFKNPHIDMDGARRSEVRRMVVLDGDYPYDSEGDASGTIDRVDDPRFRPGWPDLSPGDTITQENFYKGPGRGLPGSEDPNADPEVRWPRHTLDLSDFREEDGAMLKLVLGIRWRPGVRDGGGDGLTRTTKEFWLVSFKAKLEEG